MKRTLFGTVAALAMLVNGSVHAEVWSGFFRGAVAAPAESAWPGFYRDAAASSSPVRATLRSGQEEGGAASQGAPLTDLFPEAISRSGKAMAREERTTESTVESVESIASVAMASAVATDAGGPRGSLRLAAGYYDVIANDDEAASFSAEYHLGRQFWWVDPFAGLMVTTNGAVYGYAGLALDIVIADRIAVTPSAAIGAYHEGGGKDLGHWVEFRTGAELAYLFDNRMRLGAAFYHISNAGLGKRNPGTEILELTYSLPLGWP